MISDRGIVIALEALTEEVRLLRLAMEEGRLVSFGTDTGHNSTGCGGLSDKQVKKGPIPLCPTTIEDGFGSVWSAWCPECHEKSMQVVRPGYAKCISEKCF